MPELVLVRGNEELSRTPLGDAELILGRVGSADIVIPSARASRKHARIYRRNGDWVYEDLGSANGTQLGDDKIKEHAFADGSRLRVSDVELVFVATPGAPAVLTAPAEPDELAHPLAVSQPPDESVSQEESLEELSLDGVTVLGVAGESDLGAVLTSVFFDPTEKTRDDRNVDRLQALFEISNSVAEATDFEEVLVQIMDKAIAIMGGERGYLMLADPDTQVLRVHVARNADGGDVVGQERESFSGSLMKRVMRKRKPLLVHDAQSGDWVSESVLANEIHSAVVVPMLTQDSVTGILYVDHRSRPQAFNEQDLAFFTAFAAQAKAAIDSSRAYWELVRSLFKASGDFIVILTPDGKIKQANQGAAGIVGSTALELAGRDFADLVVSEKRDQAQAFARDALDKGVVAARELAIVGCDGKPVPLSISSFALRDQRGTTIGQCMIGRDLSELRLLIDGLEVRNEFIRKTFGRYLSDEIVANLLETPEGLRLGGEKKRVTIMMTDLRGFTAHSERIPPEQVVAILNHYLAEMTEIISRYHGTIDEIIGDALLVIFGAPIERDGDEVRACACAVEMQLKMGDVNAWNRAQGLPEVEMGIGLYTDDVVVGNIGSEKRSKYGVVGRAVNLAARIEGNTVGGQVLIAEPTYEAAKGLLRVRDTFELKVKGVDGILRAFDVEGVAGDFQLFLPEFREELFTLARPLLIRMTRLSGKSVSDKLEEAEIVALGRRQIEVRASFKAEPLTNLKLSMYPVSGGRVYSDIYCKVLERQADEDGHFFVHFTAVPPEVESLLVGLRSQSSAPKPTENR